MKRSGIRLVALALAMLVALPIPGPAQPPAPSKTFKPEELEQLVAPIALYPDPMLAQILMASTYPLEVVQAARFAKQNPNLRGEQLNQVLQQQTWDDSVKSLASFPQVLTMMNERLDWTQRLGDAFLASQKDVMGAVQRLRAMAQAAGNLKTTAEQKIIVEPAPAPQTVVVQQPAPPPPRSSGSSRPILRWCTCLPITPPWSMAPGPTRPTRPRSPTTTRGMWRGQRPSPSLRG